MKKITLFGPTIVAGAVRYPHENPATVTNNEAARLFAAGVLTGEPVDTDGDDPVEEESPIDGLDTMTVAQLTDVAVNEGADLAGKTLKDDIIAAIREQRAAVAA